MEAQKIEIITDGNRNIVKMGDTKMVWGNKPTQNNKSKPFGDNTQKGNGELTSNDDEVLGGM